MNSSKDTIAKVQATSIIFARTYSRLPIKNIENNSLSSLVPIQESLLNFTENPLSVEEYKNYKEVLMNEIKGLSKLNHFFGLVFDWVFHHFLLSKANKTEGSPPKSYDVITHHKEFIGEVEERTGQKGLSLKLKEQFFPYIPLRMTTQVFNDSIRISLQKLADNDSSFTEFILQDWKIIQDLIGDSSTKLPTCCMDLKQELDKYWTTDMSQDDMDTVREYLEQLDTIEGKIKDIAEAFFVLFDGITSALILLQYGDENSIEGIKPWLERDSEALETAIDEILDKIYDLEENPEESDELGEDEEKSELAKLFYESGLDYYIYSGIGMGSSDEDEIIDEDKIIDEAIATLTNCVEGLSSRKKRFIRQHCMKNLPFWGDVTQRDYEQYFTKTYESLDNFNKTLMTCYLEFYETVTLAHYSLEEMI